MPTVTDTLIDGYASCRDGRCPGYKQEPVKAILSLSEWTYFEQGGDIPGVEKTTVLIRFADEADEPCSVCGEPRLVADQVRPIYPNVSGVPQDALLQVGRDSERVRELQLEAAKRDAEMARMREQMERQSAQLEQLMTRPRGPGRPRKPEE